MMSFTMPNKVQKSNDKKVKRTQKKEKVLQTPLNDLAAYKNIDIEEIRAAVPEDGSIPTWREVSGKVVPMVKSRAEDGSFEFRPRKKRGPAAGKKYRPRAAKIAQIMKLADANNGAISMSGMKVLNECVSLLPGSRKPFENAGESNDFAKAKAEEDKTVGEKSTTKNGVVDYQALVHAWQMRSMGILQDKEFQVIKQSVFKSTIVKAEENKPVIGAEKEEEQKEESMDVEMSSDNQMMF